LINGIIQNDRWGGIIFLKKRCGLKKSSHFCWGSVYIGPLLLILFFFFTLNMGDVPAPVIKINLPSSAATI